MYHGEVQVIIAECGQNHCGDMNLAKLLITLAKENGTDLCKFQLYSHEALYKDHPEIPNVELSFDDAKMLFDYGASIGMEVFFSVFDVERVDWCEKIGVKRYKIAYSMNNKPVIKALEKTHKPIISSNPLYIGHTYLYCVNEYPTPHDHIEGSMLGQYDGFSDHTIGLDAAKIAFARGAQIVEKHFALDHDTGVDAKWSMTPTELKELKAWENTCKVIF